MVGHAVEKTAGPNCTMTYLPTYHPTYTNTKHNYSQSNKYLAYVQGNTYLKHHMHCFACLAYDKPTHARERTPPVQGRTGQADHRDGEKKLHTHHHAKTLQWARRHGRSCSGENGWSVPTARWPTYLPTILPTQIPNITAVRVTSI